MTKHDTPVIGHEAAPQHANIYEAINAVMAEVSFIQKKKTANLPYSFAGETTIIDSLRESMINHGIVMLPVGIEDLRLETYQTKNQAKDGGSTNRVVAKFSFDFVHAPSGTSHRVTTLGEGADVGDKAANKSMTASKKYALLQSFLLRSGDDPDEVPSSDYERNKPAAAPLEKRHWSENPLAVSRFGQYLESNGLTIDDLIAVFGSENLFELPDDMPGIKVALDTYSVDKYASAH